MINQVHLTQIDTIQQILRNEKNEKILQRTSHLKFLELVMEKLLTSFTWRPKTMKEKDHITICFSLNILNNYLGDLGQSIRKLFQLIYTNWMAFRHLSKSIPGIFNF